MRPAASVILFTVLSGTGYGCLAVIGLVAVMGDLPESSGLALTTMAIALTLVTAGLASSTFHLGHPERAWRALSQWRSSWLSREGCAALATYLPAGLFSIGWVLLERSDGVYAFLAALSGLAALTTVFCTGMIYASLRTIRQWNHPLVVPLYLAYALLTGALICAALLALTGAWIPWLVWICACFVALTWVLKHLYWRDTDAGQSDSTLATAIGLPKAGPVQTLDPPHSEENYLMREMGFRVARKHARRLRGWALRCGGTLPLALIAGALASPSPGLAAGLLAIAAPVALMGVFIERWLFFAEATHVVTLYYGRRAA
jgi:DMSO reductase anchor subunit